MITLQILQLKSGRKNKKKTRINEVKNQRTKKYTKKEEVEIVRMKNTPKKTLDKL